MTFITWDGKKFTDYKQASSHEESIGKPYKMFDRDGEPTDDTDCAHIVHLYPNGADAFIRACESEHTSHGGVYENIREEWYLWDEGLEEYRYIPNDTLAGLVKIFSRG